MSQSSKSGGDAPRSNTDETKTCPGADEIKGHPADDTTYPVEPETLEAKGKSARIGLIVSFGISAAILGGLFYFADLSEFLRQIKKANLWYVPLLAALSLFSFYLRAIRWRYLLPTGAKLSSRELFDSTLLGTFASSILPLRAGEFIRPWVLSRSGEVSFAAAFASIVTERVFDVLALLVLLAACLGEISNMPPLVTTGAKALGVIAGVIVVLMIVAYLKAQLIIKALDAILRRLLKEHKHELREKIIILAEEFLIGLRGISSLSQLGLVFIWSLILWLELGLLYQFGLWAMGEHVGFYVGLLTSILVAFAVAAPSAPGFIGTFQAGCVVALTGICGFEHEFSLAYAVFIHGAQFGAVILVSLILLNLKGMTFADLRKHKQG